MQLILYVIIVIQHLVEIINKKFFLSKEYWFSQSYVNFAIRIHY